MKNRGVYGSIATLLLPVTLASAASAQEAPPPPTAPQADPMLEAEDIIVSARKLGETAGDAPATITILTEAALEQKNVTTGADLSGIVPGLVQMVGTGSSPTTTFRGVGSNAAVFGVESSVAFYQDGVYLSRPRDYITPLYDIDHLELIKGTQSTLLGKNTTLGAISVVSRRPRDAFEGRISYKHGFTVDSNRVDAVINVPVSPDLSLRAAGVFAQEDGWVDNAFNDTDTRDISGRLSAAWTPGALDILLTYQHDDHRQKGQIFEIVADPLGVIARRRLAVGQIETDAVQNRRATYGGRAFMAVPAGVEPFDREVGNRVNFVTNAPIGEHNLTVQSSYIGWRAAYANDLDHTVANLYRLEDTQRSEQFSQEVRLTSPSNQPLTYLAGAYFYYNRWDFTRRLTAFSPIGLIPTQPPASPAQGVLGGTSGNFFNDFQLKTTTYSIFGSATYDFTERFSLTAGLRHTWEAKEGRIERTGVGGLGTVAFQRIPLTRLSRDERALDYDASVQFRPTDDLMLYLTYSKGSKSGGYQEAPQSLAAIEYTGERAKTIEGGAKLSVAGVGNAALAIFQTKIEDFQANYTLVVAGAQSSYVGNTPLRTRGVEFSGNVRPAQGLNLGGSVVYADAQFRDFLGGATPANAVTFPGQRAPRAPLWTAQGDITYETALGGPLMLTLNANLSHQSRAYLNNLNFATGDAPFSRAHEDLGARISLANREQGWELSLTGNNLLNQTWVTFATRASADQSLTAPAPALGQRSYQGAVSRPRVISIQASYKF